MNLFCVGIAAILVAWLCHRTGRSKPYTISSCAVPIPRLLSYSFVVLHVVGGFCCIWMLVWYTNDHLDVSKEAFLRHYMVVVDSSGSMKEPLGASSKMHHVKTAVMHMVLALKAEAMLDKIGLISFARAAYVQHPLSSDRETFCKALLALQPIENNQLNGTAIGYALYKTVLLLAACQQWGGKPYSQTIILITDGMQEPHPLDKTSVRYMTVAQALERASNYNIHIQYIVLGAHKQYGIELDLLKQKLQANGGGYYEAHDSDTLEHIMHNIIVSQSSLQSYSGIHIDHRWSIVGLLISITTIRLLEYIWKIQR